VSSDKLENVSKKRAKPLEWGLKSYSRGPTKKRYVLQKRRKKGKKKSPR
jgi:hypothetical protein